jgi:hypothetical protein
MIHVTLQFTYTYIKGAEAVDWLVEHRYARTRVEAVMLGNDLMDSGHFHHVADKTDYVGARSIPPKSSRRTLDSYPARVAPPPPHRRCFFLSPIV